MGPRFQQPVLLRRLALSLAKFKSIALLVGATVSCIDEIILWAQHQAVSDSLAKPIRRLTLPSKDRFLTLNDVA